MKKIFCIKNAWFALSLLLVACSSEEFISDELKDSNEVTMTARDFEYDASSRTDFDITDKGAIFRWSEGDQVGVFPEQGAQANFDITSGAGSLNATFNGGGWALKPSCKYMAYYPLIRDFEVKYWDVPLSYEGQKQPINGSTSHLGKYDYMAASATTPQEGKAQFSFHHLGCLVQLSFTLPDRRDWKSVDLFSATPFFATSGTVDLRNPQINVTNLSRKLTLPLPDMTTVGADGVVTIYFMMAPVDMEGKYIQLVLHDGSERFEGGIMGKNYVAGKAYKMSAPLKKQELWVDMGVSVEWATCNVGACHPTDFGGHYAWGELLPKTKFYDQYYKPSNEKELGKSIFEISGMPLNDAATYTMGGGARMPSGIEMKELMDNSDQTKEGYGYRVISKINGNSIYFPYAGSMSFNDGLPLQPEDGAYWSGSCHRMYNANAYYFQLNNWYFRISNYMRYLGHSIRAVRDKK